MSYIMSNEEILAANAANPAVINKPTTIGAVRHAAGLAASVEAQPAEVNEEALLALQSRREAFDKAWEKTLGRRIETVIVSRPGPVERRDDW